MDGALELHPGFILLDNLDNLRPDLRASRPIRNFLESKELAEDTYYGFLSPKFVSKAKMTSHDVAILADAKVPVSTDGRASGAGT